MIYALLDICNGMLLLPIPPPPIPSELDGSDTDDDDAVREAGMCFELLISVPPPDPLPHLRFRLMPDVILVCIVPIKYAGSIFQYDKMCYTAK